MNLVELIRNRDLSAVHESIAAGVDVNAPDTVGLTPLGAVAHSGDLEITKALVEAKADVNGETVDPTGLAKKGELVQPMLVAGLSGHWQVYLFLALRTRKPIRNASLKQLKKRHLRLIRKRGTDPLVRALVKACETGDQESVSSLIAQGVDVNSGDEHWGSPMLAIAASNGHPGIVQLLITAGAPVNGPIGDESPSLMYAVNGEVAKVLIDAGADPNLFSIDGGIETPLIRACGSNRFDVVEMLIKAGADMNVVGGVQGCALSESMKSKSDDIALLLIASGANVNLAPRGFWPPLSHAAYLGKERVVVALLAAGANVLHKSKDSSGTPNAPPETALALATLAGHEGIAAILQGAIEGTRSAGGS